MLHWTPGFIKALISLVSAMFFVNHFAYLSVGRFDYQYNMKTNIITGMCYIHELIDEIKKKRNPQRRKTNESINRHFKALQPALDGSFGIYRNEKNGHTLGK